MISHANGIRVEVSNPICSSHIESLFHVDRQQLMHKVILQNPYESVGGDEDWTIHYCGIYKKGSSVKVSKIQGGPIRYCESSISLLADGDFGLGSVAKALSVPVFDCGSCNDTVVELVRNDAAVKVFRGAYLFLEAESRQATIVMLSEMLDPGCSLQNTWIDLRKTEDKELSYVLRCLKAAI